MNIWQNVLYCKGTSGVLCRRFSFDKILLARKKSGSWKPPLKSVVLSFEVSDLPISRLEQEVNTAPQTSNFVLIGLLEGILTGEELSSCYDVLCESVVSTELPALQGVVSSSTGSVVIGCAESCEWAELTICSVDAPGTLVSGISTLVLEQPLLLPHATRGADGRLQ